MRYVLYDKTSGAILHTHQSFKFDNNEPQDAAEEDIRLVMDRLGEPDKLDLTRTTVSVVSSRQAEMTVDLKTNKVAVKPLTTDPLSRRLDELHKAEEKED
jgi:hypothetical protein